MSHELNRQAELYNRSMLDFMSEQTRLRADDADAAEQLRLKMQLMEQMQAQVEVLDGWDHAEFAKFEMVSGFCYIAYRNGVKVKAKIAEQVGKIREAERGFTGDEIGDVSLQRLNKALTGYKQRYHFWRCYYAAAARVYEDTVRALPFDFLPNKWSPPSDEKRSSEVRRITAAQYEAEQASRTSKAHH